MIDYFQPIFAVIDPQKAGDLLKKYQAAVFPEDKFDDLKYYKQAEESFKKLRGVTLKAHIIHS